MNLRSLLRELARQLVRFRAGRVILNLAAMIQRPAHARFFLRGVRREIAEMLGRKPRR